MSLRGFEGWWFHSNTPTPTSIDGTASPASINKSKERWIPFIAHDNDRLEKAHATSSFCDFDDSVVVHDGSCQRLSAVSLGRMTMEAIYWKSECYPVRRATWLQMYSTAPDDNIKGGFPVIVEWDRILEKVYREHFEWITSEQSTSSNEVIEKMVSLEEPLTEYVLIMRQGFPDKAKLTSKSRIEGKSSIFNMRDDSIRLIRGYSAYYINVSSCIKAAELEGESVEGIAPSLESPFEPLNEEVPKAPSNVVLAVHGIGQKLARRLGADFIADCKSLRDQCNAVVADRSGNVNDLLVLPINWRSTLHMGIKSYFSDNDQEDSFESLVSMITLPNIPVFRDIASDVGLDVLLYMTPAYFVRIINATLSEIHRIYQLFLKVGGIGADKAKVSFLGHSLGAAIVSDLLSFIIKKDADETSILDLAKGVVCDLGFPVERFFAIGSPLPMFFLLKQLKPVGCVDDIHNIRCDKSERRSVYPSLPETPSDADIHHRQVMFACRQVYNIFHPFDPIAYRMEPLILKPEEMSSFSLPIRLPYYKKGALHLKRQMQEQVQSLQDKALKAKEDFLNSLPEWMRRRNPSTENLMVDGNAEHFQVPLSSTSSKASSTPSLSARSSPRSHSALLKFNHHGRIDFSVEESLLENSYFAAIRSHFSYWDDIDVASFIVSEITNLKEPPSTPSSPRPK